MVEIREVKTVHDIKKFVKFPYKLYSKNVNWVPPMMLDEINTLRWDKNPAFEYSEARYWMAYRAGEPVGRIAAIINRRYQERWNNKYIRFGWVDFIDDEEVSKALFNTVENWAREKGLVGIHGPLGFCDMDHQGMLIEGFNELSMMITYYNYPYYPVHLEKLGYAKDVDWIEFQLFRPEVMPEKLAKIAEIARRRLKLKIVHAKKSKELLKYAKGLFELVNEAYKDLYGVVALSDRQMDAYTKQYFSFIDPNYVSVILDESDKMAGFAITMPSLSKAMQKAKGRILPFGFLHILRALKKTDSLDLYLIAVRPDLQGKGVNAILLTEIARICFDNDIRMAETGPELEVNTRVQEQWKFFETRQHKRRRCFIKHLSLDSATDTDATVTDTSATV